MGTSQAVIATDGLTKHYGNVEALVDLTLELKAARREGREVPRLTGRTIALVGEFAITG